MNEMPNPDFERLQRGDLQISVERRDSNFSPRQLFSRVQKGVFRSLEIFVERNGIRKSINDLLPENWSLLEQQGAGLRHEGASLAKSKTIAVHSHVGTPIENQPFFSESPSMYVLLHEVGHAHDQTRLQNIPGYTPEKLSNANLAMLSYWSGHDFGNPTTPDDVETFVLRSEESADAFAISIIERWRAEGIDLEPGVTLETLRLLAEENQKQYHELLYRLRNRIPRNEKIDENLYMPSL